MIDLPEPQGDLRGELGIPPAATVFGRHGGRETFDLQMAKEAIRDALDRRDDLWFLFMNTDSFLTHNRVVYLPGVSDLQEKARFIATCDAMVHAREQGETFGIAIGEFSAMNKPVLTWTGSPDRCHLAILGDTALTYTTKGDLLNILSSFDRTESSKKNWDRYRNAYAPKPVMEKFQEVFLS
jgi:hypothetical protein